jgi:hypothetical protein
MTHFITKKCNHIIYIYFEFYYLDIKINSIIFMLLFYTYIF